jgi:hypothetical protein
MVIILFLHILLNLSPSGGIRWSKEMLLHVTPVVIVSVPRLIGSGWSRSGLARLFSTEPMQNLMLSVLNHLTLNIGQIVLAMNLNLHVKNVPFKPA